MAPRPAASASAAPKGRALLSVSDKSGLAELGKGLSDLGYELVSTGGTLRALQEAGLEATAVDSVTGFPEMLDGRVKTLHPGVHGGILARRDLPDHMSKVDEHGIGLIDLVVANLYPFRETVAGGGDFAACVENVDVGGPAMLRAAAKNHSFCLPVVDPADYDGVVQALGGGGDDEGFRRRLAWKAFQHCASYDAVVAEWMWSEDGGNVGKGAPPPEQTVPLRFVSTLRYGENSHQPAAFYTDGSIAESSSCAGVGFATLHHGKEMSYNNYLDADAAFGCVCDLAGPSCVVVKHTNPCGAATREDLLEAYRLAVRADPISAFGGIVAFNREVTAELAREIREFRSPTDGETRMFYEIVVAPGYTEEGLEVLKGKSKNLRILEAKPRGPGAPRQLRQVGGGWLQQAPDALTSEDVTFEVQTEAQPTAQQMADLKFAWACVKHVKSNAIVVAKGDRMLGMGSGQPNRVNSTRIALEKGEGELEGSVLASDAFFPFAWGDSVEIACKAGVKAIAHPGGSMRDQDAVDVCNKYGVALVTTGVRHFRH